MPSDSDDDEPITDSAPGSASTVPNGQGSRPLKERIAAAKEQARQGRIAAGLPADADDGPFSEEALAARAKGRRRRR